VTEPQISRLVGVYDAEGTLRGELTYFVGARLGRAHCALCDITHGLLRERTEWRECRDGLAVPFDTFHRDDQPAEVRTAVAGRAPVVAAETDQGVVLLLGPDALDACGGSGERLVAAIEDAVVEAGLRWPDPAV
jgi:hypothetical protein